MIKWALVYMYVQSLSSSATDANRDVPFQDDSQVSLSMSHVDLLLNGNKNMCIPLSLEIQRGFETYD